MITKVIDRTPEVTHFAAACQWTGIMSEDRDVWLAERHNYLTASDMAAVLGQDKWRSAFQVYTDKITPRKGKEVITIKDPRFWGSALEQTILTRAAAYHGWDYTAGGALLVSRRYPHLAATLDGEINRGNGWEDCEGKTSSYLMRHDWDEDTQDVPRRVLIQVQHQLLVTGADRALVICLINGNHLIQISVEPSEAFHSMLIEESERFMGMVRDRIEPLCAANDSALLDRLYPEHGGGIVQLPSVSLEWARELELLGRQRRDIDKREKQVKNWLKRSIASATWGKLPEPVAGKQWFKWATEEVPAFQVAAHTKSVLRPIKNGPRFSGTLPLALPVSLNELEDQLVASVEAGAPEHVEITKLPSKKRRKARR
jgi:putative phage-type endonuclease